MKHHLRSELLVFWLKLIPICSFSFSGDGNAILLVCSGQKPRSDSWPASFAQTAHVDFSQSPLQSLWSQLPSSLIQIIAKFQVWSPCFYPYPSPHLFSIQQLEWSLWKKISPCLRSTQNSTAISISSRVKANVFSTVCVIWTQLPTMSSPTSDSTTLPRSLIHKVGCMRVERKKWRR